MPSGWFSDTSPEALKVYIDLHRRMTPGERVARIFELCEFQNALQTANVRALYPQADERQVFLRVAARRLGRDLTIAAYGWGPDLHR